MITRQSNDDHVIGTVTSEDFSPFNNFTSFKMTVIHVTIPFSKVQYNSLKSLQVIKHKDFNPRYMPINYENLTANQILLSKKSMVTLLAPEDGRVTKKKDKTAKVSSSNRSQNQNNNQKRPGNSNLVVGMNHGGRTKFDEAVSMPRGTIPFHSFYFLESFQRLLHEPGIMENMMAYPRFDDRPSTEIRHSRIFRESPLFSKYEKLPCGIALGDFLSVRDTEKYSGNPRGDTIWIAQLTSIYENARTETLQKSGGLPVIKFEVRPLYERSHVLRVSKSMPRPQGNGSSESSRHELDINRLRSVNGKLSEVERDI